MLHGYGAYANPNLIIDSFSYPSKKIAQKKWVSKNKSPAVVFDKKNKNQLTFPCTFTDVLKRVYWDRSVSLNLAQYSSFIFDVSSQNPQIIRKISIYFKSGSGWYISNQPILQTGRQQLTLKKSDFGIEGTPSGWDRIEAIRLSPWKETAGKASLIAHSLTAQSDSILLIQGTASIPTERERHTAKTVTKRISEWLTDMNIAHGVIEDRDVSDTTLSQAQIAVLPYNHTLPIYEIKALKRFVQRGGKLTVFFSADKNLAKLMSLQLGDKKSSIPGNWNAMVFSPSNRYHGPETVLQASWNIRPVYPATKTGKIIAYWENSRDEITQDPAWVETEQGLWMTHILLQGDDRAKKDMLLELIGHYDPSVWFNAAQQAFRKMGTFANYNGFKHAIDAIQAESKKVSQKNKIKELISNAKTKYSTALSQYKEGEYRQVITSCHKIRNLLITCYGLLQKSKSNELRGVWDHQGVGWYPGNWDRTCKELAARGINAIFPNMLWGGIAHYKSKILPRSDTFRRYGDQLAQCIQAAHNYGLEVHVWNVCWNLNGASDDFIEKMKQQGRLQVSDKGKTLPWLNPAHPKNMTLAVESLKEIASQYPVDGIHLDYVRYPGSYTCYSDVSKKRFEKWKGMPLSGWPTSAYLGGTEIKNYQRFRTDQINLFVRSTYKAIKAINPKIKLSAAVFGKYPSCINSVGQDWGHWLKKGMIDFVCPMNYTVNLAQFKTYTKDQLAMPQARGKIYPGIGITAAESRLTPDLAIQQIVALRTLGAKGFILFDLDNTLREETLPILNHGIMNAGK